MVPCVDTLNKEHAVFRAGKECVLVDLFGVYKCAYSKHVDGLHLKYYVRMPCSLHPRRGMTTGNLPIQASTLG